MPSIAAYWPGFNVEMLVELRVGVVVEKKRGGPVEVPLQRGHGRLAEARVGVAGSVVVLVVRVAGQVHG